MALSDCVRLFNGVDSTRSLASDVVTKTSSSSSSSSTPFDSGNTDRVLIRGGGTLRKRLLVYYRVPTGSWDENSRSFPGVFQQILISSPGVLHCSCACCMCTFVGLLSILLACYLQII